jgi:ABC-type sugar transport system ATPase subunit
MQVADRIVIMRRGKVAANMPREGATEEIIVRHMVGTAEAAG